MLSLARASLPQRAPPTALGGVKVFEASYSICTCYLSTGLISQGRSVLCCCCGGPQISKNDEPTAPAPPRVIATATAPIPAAITGAPPIAAVCNSAYVDPFAIAPPARPMVDIHVAAYVPATGPAEEKPIVDRAQLPRYASDVITTMVVTFLDKRHIIHIYTLMPSKRSVEARHEKTEQRRKQERKKFPTGEATENHFILEYIFFLHLKFSHEVPC